MPFAAMPVGLLIGFGVMLLLSALGWATRQLKKATDQREEEARQARRKRLRQGQGTGDIDRFLEEVDRQRRGEAPTRPAPRPASRPDPIPTAKPVAASKRGRLADTVGGGSFPEAKPAAASRANVDDLPVAAVVAAPGRSPTTAVTRPARLVKPLRASVAPPSPTAVAATPFARQFIALLAGPQSLATAVVLHEVLGPPKCKQHKTAG